MALPDPPYYAVIFTARQSDDTEGYAEAAQRMEELAAQQPGYLGFEAARGPDGLGIAVSYWRSEDDIRAWKRNIEHTAAREQGRARWYSNYKLRVAKVERAYEFEG